MKVKSALLAGVFAALTLPVSAQTASFGQSPVSVLIEERIVEEYDGVLPSDAEIEIQTEADTGTGLMLDHWQYDRQTGRFIASVRVDETGAGATRLSGRVQIVVPALVPNRRIAAGEVISERDLAQIRMPLGLVTANMLRAEDDILGMEVRRPLMPERPIQAQALIEPRAVRKGEDIDLTYELNGMKLTATGRATQDAAIGDEIRVLNKTSRKHVMAEVVAPGRAAITSQTYAE